MPAINSITHCKPSRITTIVLTLETVNVVLASMKKVIDPQHKNIIHKGNTENALAFKITVFNSALFLCFIPINALQTNRAMTATNDAMSIPTISP